MGDPSEKARLLQSGRRHDAVTTLLVFDDIEAVEPAIWLTEFAPDANAAGNHLLDHIIKKLTENLLPTKTRVMRKKDCSGRFRV
jgi:hypothetical protein